MNEVPQQEEKKIQLKEIRDVITKSVRALVLDKDYKKVILNLTTGNIVVAAERLGWKVSDPEWSGALIETYRDLKKAEDFGEIVSNLATNSHAIYDRNSGEKRLDLPFVDMFKEEDFFSDPKNDFDPSIKYDIADVQRLAFENCLLLLEEWCHLLQWETEAALSSKFRGLKDGEYDSEADVAWYFRNLGVNLSGTIFERRYSGARRISEFLKKDQN